MPTKRETEETSCLITKYNNMFEPYPKYKIYKDIAIFLVNEQEVKSMGTIRVD